MELETLREWIGHSQLFLITGSGFGDGSGDGNPKGLLHDAVGEAFARTLDRVAEEFMPIARTLTRWNCIFAGTPWQDRLCVTRCA